MTYTTNKYSYMTYTSNKYSDDKGQRKKKKNRQLSLQLEVALQKHKKQTKGMWYIKGKMSYASDRRLGID